MNVRCYKLNAQLVYAPDSIEIIVPIEYATIVLSYMPQHNELQYTVYPFYLSKMICLFTAWIGTVFTRLIFINYSMFMSLSYIIMGFLMRWLPIVFDLRNIVDLGRIF